MGAFRDVRRALGSLDKALISKKWMVNCKCNLDIFYQEILSDMV